MPYADTQWEVPDSAKPREKEWAEKGYSWQTRLWIDDMYMITIVQTQAYKVTGDPKYLDRAAKEMVLYLDELQRPNGLFYHAPDVPYYWGRGNGWMAAGVTELLRYLPKDHKDRPRIMKGYRTMMKSLKEYQRPGGMWNQLIDEPDCWGGDLRIGHVRLCIHYRGQTRMAECPGNMLRLPGKPGWPWCPMSMKKAQCRRFASERIKRMISNTITTVRVERETITDRRPISGV